MTSGNSEVTFSAVMRFGRVWMRVVVAGRVMVAVVDILAMVEQCEGKEAR